MRRSRLHSRLAGFAALLCTQLATAADETLPDPPKPGTFTFAIRSGGLERTAVVHVPTGYTAGDKPPLVLMLHGAGGHAKQALEHDGWIAMSDKAGFIAVAADGLPVFPRQPPNFVSNPQVWNSGQLRPRGPRAAIDDVAYIRQLLDDLQRAIPYNPRQVYCTGHSNGGGMTFRLGAELSDRFAAIATVAGMIAVDNPKPKHPLPTLYILGTRDPLMPINGGEVKLPWGTRQNPPVADQLTKWARALGCQTEPQEVSNKDGVQRLRYPSSSGGPELSVIYLEGHGHQWPGGKRALPRGDDRPDHHQAQRDRRNLAILHRSRPEPLISSPIVLHLPCPAVTSVRTVPFATNAAIASSPGAFPPNPAIPPLLPLPAAADEGKRLVRVSEWADCRRPRGTACSTRISLFSGFKLLTTWAGRSNFSATDCRAN